MDSKVDTNPTVLKDYGSSVFDFDGGLKHKREKEIKWVTPTIGLLE